MGVLESQLGRRAIMAMATSVLLGGARVSPPAHAAIELSDEAALVAQAWGNVKLAYVDGSRLAQTDWEGKRARYLRGVNYKSMEQARGAIREMLVDLDDRWTRLISPEELELTSLRYTNGATSDVSDGIELIAEGGVVLLRIGRMGARTPERVRAALAGLAAPPAELWLDLRGNLGGSFQAAVGVASLFLSKGQRVVSVRRRVGIPETFDAIEDGPFAVVPLHILVDRNTASAAEVLVGALRDNGRADLRGERTYGKGVIQTVVKLNDGSALEITVARYETPAGRSINQLGFEPDVPLVCAAQMPVDERTSRTEAQRGLACARGGV
jgi:C-terminal processing protease CtpA/Prc